MTFQPFKLGNIDIDKNPDKCHAKLEHWINTVIPVFLNSTEYKKLSKANQKSQGSWFQAFMEMSLSHIGEDLGDLDEEDTAYILMELFPHKIICPDSQVKTIVPELIAFWQFLDRELNGGKNKTLEFSKEIIKFLHGIKKDYLIAFKGKVDTAQLPSGDMLQALMDQLIPVENPDWVEHLVMDLANNLPAINELPEPPEQWAVLLEPSKFEDFLQHVLTIGFDDDFQRVSAAVEELLIYACQNLFMRIRQKDKEAITFWKQAEKNIIGANDSDMLIPESMHILIHALSQYRQFLSQEFQNFIHEWRMIPSSQKVIPEGFSLDGLNDIFQSMLNEASDEFTFITILKEQCGFMPGDALSQLIHQLLKLGEQAADALVLLILEHDEQQAIAVAEAISQHPETINPKTLSRLIRIRNWLTAPVQKSVDKLIKTVRKRGVMPEAPEPTPNQNLQEVHMSGVDGSGAQGVMLMVKEDTSFRMVTFVLKEAIGVVDVLVTPPDTKASLKKFFSMAKQQMTNLEKVSVDLIRKQLPYFIALNLKSKNTIDHELVQTMELLGLEDWNPTSLNFNNLYANLIPHSPSKEAVDQAQKRSGKWTETGIGTTWFVEGHRLQKVIDSSPVKELYTTICTEVLNPEKENWAQRMGRMALWAEHADSKRRQQQGQDYAMVNWLLEHSRMPAHEIELLRAIAKNSIQY